MERFTSKEAKLLAKDAVARFENGDEKGFYEILDKLTKSKSGFAVLRSFGSEIGKRVCLEPDKSFVLFDNIMHRPREVSYNPQVHEPTTRSIDKNISALVYGARTAIVGSAFSEMRKEHWQRIVAEIERYNLEFSEWYVVDSWCHNPMGYIIAEHPKEMIEKLTEWSECSNFWFRKASAVYMHALFVGYPGRDISPYLKLLDKLILDENAKVRIGVAWSLREMAKNYEPQLLDFLKKWSKVEGVSKFIFREALKKLDRDARKEALRWIKL
jgi:3-methyladenine DNA glycosylase AlkD